jgi:hypothetical protein
MTSRMLTGLLADLLTTHRDDPANAQYLVPLEDAEDERLAHGMADAIYGAMAEHFRDDITQEQADRAYEQALIDSRRMICDEDYLRIFSE